MVRAACERVLKATRVKPSRIAAAAGEHSHQSVTTAVGNLTPFLRLFHPLSHLIFRQFAIFYELAELFHYELGAQFARIQLLLVLALFHLLCLQPDQMVIVDFLMTRSAHVRE